MKLLRSNTLDKSKIIKALKLFNEKADKLEGSSFTKSLANSGITISGKQGQPIKAERRGPDDESIDAFVLTIRFFVQDNEATSFRRMAALYAELTAAPDLMQKFNDARMKTNDALDKTSSIKVNSAELTYRAIFETFLWGGLAHANPEKKAVFDSWAPNPILFPLLQNEFVYALGILLNMIFYTRALNNAVLTLLQN